MLNYLIRFSLKNRGVVIACALLVLLLGLQTTRELPVEVLPDMTKPTVTILTESPTLLLKRSKPSSLAHWKMLF